MLLSEMFGVERDTEFGVEGYHVTFKIAKFLEEYEYLMYRWSDKLDWREAEGTLLCSVIAGAPANIIHLPPPLTDEQREQLRAIWTLGGRWLAKDSDMAVNACVDKPVKHELQWTGNEYFAVCATLIVSSLISWSDPEPYDIGKALGVGNEIS